MKWINFLFNPSKRIKHLLTEKKEDDPSYVLKKRLVKLNLPVTSNLQTISYFSVFSKLFLLLGLTLVSGFGFYFKYEEIASIIGIDKLNGFFLLLGPMYYYFFGALCWVIGYYCWLSFLPLATFILAITTGICFSSLFVGYRLSFLEFPKCFFILYLLFWIPFLTTVFVLSSVSFLYYFKKICLSEKKVNLVTTIFFFFHLISIIFLFYHHWADFDNSILIVISIVLAILHLVLSTLMWVVNLQKLDELIERKIPLKYQWLVISTLFILTTLIFVNILYIVLVIIKMMNIDEK